MLPSNAVDTFPNQLTFRLCSIWLLFAISSLVFIEPAPYDGVLILVSLYCFTFGLRLAPHLSLPSFFLCGYMLANLLATVFAIEPLQSLQHMAVTFFLIFNWLFITSVVYDNPPLMYKVIWQGYVFAAVLAACLGLIGFFKLTSFYEQFMYLGRVQGPFKDPNVFAPFLVPAAIYLILQLENAQNTRHFFMHMLSLLIVMSGVLLSFSRGAWVNMALSFVFYTILRITTAKSRADTLMLMKIIILVVGTVTAAIIWAVTKVDDIANIFSFRAQLVQDYDQGSGGRFDGILNAINQSMLHPMGVGPGQNRVVLSHDPHNLFVHIMIETGWLGAIAFSGFVIVTLKEAYAVCLRPSSIQKMYIVLFACLFATLLESMIIHSTHWRHLYVLFGLIWGGISAQKSKLI